MPIARRQAGSIEGLRLAEPACPKSTAVSPGTDAGLEQAAASPRRGAIAPAGIDGRSRVLFLGLREQAPRWQVVLMALLGVGTCFALWWFVTRGEPEERILPPSKGLSSPAETFASFHSLWFDRGLTRNLLTTLRRVGAGLRAGRARGRAAGHPLRLLPAGQRVLPAADALRPQHPGGRPDPADLLALRHRRAAEGDVHLHRLRGVHRLRHGPGDRRGRASRTSIRPTPWGPAGGRSS